MTELVKIPMFPLSIFPLPGEMVPLHIFEPRYKQLLHDAEIKDISFGIYFNHVSNVEKVGSLVKLESVIKRYENGESDVIVKCTDLFSLNTLYRTFRDRPYPGGEVTHWNVDASEPANDKLRIAFKEYLLYFQISNSDMILSTYAIANELGLDFEERLRFVKYEDEQKQKFLLAHLRYQSELLHQAEKSRDVFHLN
ncbi:MAG: LON peptidase substrate-binding domain-containing protein [Bacteroidetes bacterium]|nr:LON peptidase substrate-binding domain-containing protein [Bacteroidota bacterium]MBI3483188.1 LON peptidase substrate-binding domain-containing protein [Bacteroidota bacterium]